MDVPIRIWLGGVARRTGGLERDVWKLRQRDHLGQIRPGRVGPAEVIDDQLQPGMALGDLAHRLHEVAADQRHRQAGALGGRPQPVHGAVGQPRLLMWREERKA